MRPHICYKARSVSMRNVTALLALLIACGTGTVKSQNSTSLRSAGKQQLALNFIENVSFTPQVLNNPAITGSPVLNTTVPVKTMNEVIAEPAVENNIERISALQFKYAMMMDVEVEALTNTALYTFIDDWYGTHYRMGGTTKNGIDCSAFSGTLFSSIYSVALPRTAKEQYNVCEHLNRENLTPGDLVFFHTRGRGVSHVGVYLANNYFVHSSSTDGVKISSLDDPYYSRTFVSGGRVNP
jgi:cell wall-associated NlpC family hydrolase